MNPQFRAVIFDMDGLLVDSEPVWAVCESALLEARGKQWDAAIQEGLIGKRIDEFLRGMIVGYGLEDDYENMRDELLATMCSLIPEQVVPRPGAPELLVYLAEQRVPCAIASSAARVIIDTVVTSQGWGHYFAISASADEVARGKPAPDVYLEAARQLGIAPADCLTLEDSPNGARAAVAAGMICYAVPDPSHTHPEAFRDVTPHVFDSLFDVLAALQQRVQS